MFPVETGESARLLGVEPNGFGGGSGHSAPIKVSVDRRSCRATNRPDQYADGCAVAIRNGSTSGDAARGRVSEASDLRGKRSFEGLVGREVVEVLAVVVVLLAVLEVEMGVERVRELTERIVRDGRAIVALMSWRTFIVRDLGSLLLGRGGSRVSFGDRSGGMFSS